MNGRTVLTIVNFAIVVAVIGVLLVYPQFSGLAFYFLVGWLVAGLVLFYQPWSSRPVGGPTAAPAAAGAPSASGSPGVGAPLPSAPASAPLDFCVYCAAPIAPTASSCAACGHPRGRF